MGIQSEVYDSWRAFGVEEKKVWRRLDACRLRVSTWDVTGARVPPRGYGNELTDLTLDTGAGFMVLP